MRILRAIAAHPTGRIGAGIILLYLLLTIVSSFGINKIESSVGKQEAAR